MQVFGMASFSSSGPLSGGGNAVIVVATESHRDSLLPRLQTLGLDIDAAIEQGRYISLDAAETILIFMNNDLPDPVRFSKVTGELIAGAPRLRRENMPALPLAENVRLSCGLKVKQRRRFGSNISGMR